MKTLIANIARILLRMMAHCDYTALNSAAILEQIYAELLRAVTRTV